MPKSKSKSQFSLFTILSATLVGAMLISNIITLKQFLFFGVSVPCGVFIFFITYIISDLFSEIYGYTASRKTAWLAFALNLAMVAILAIVQIVHAVPWAPEQDAAFNLLGPIPSNGAFGSIGALLAGFIAYQIGDWFNDLFFKYRKRIDGDKKFFIRAVGSSMIGEALDSLIYIGIAFNPWFGLIAKIDNWYLMIVIQWLFKVGFEVVIFPLTVFVKNKVLAYEGKEAYVDTESKSILG
jgi:uncharacterized integral membrane protein (TIGR00697 family)